MEERLVHFALFGQEFTFYSDAPESEVEEVVRILRSELEGSEGEYVSTVPSSKLLVLGCLRIAARYVKVNREFNAYRNRQGRSIDDLIDKMSDID
ncbi:MAG TPA: cell division protein ZapA [Desulfobulbaceae bacterium]|nr:cell division protein ZapA [Desulfobulbaceae bacterium]